MAASGPEAALLLGAGAGAEASPCVRLHPAEWGKVVPFPPPRPQPPRASSQACGCLQLSEARQPRREKGSASLCLGGLVPSYLRGQARGAMSSEPDEAHGAPLRPGSGGAAPAHPSLDRSAVWGREIVRPERVALSSYWVLRMALGGVQSPPSPCGYGPSSPAHTLHVHVLSVGTRAPGGDSPPPEPSSAAAPRQQGLRLLWGLLWGRGGPLPPAGLLGEELASPGSPRLHLPAHPGCISRLTPAASPGAPRAPLSVVPPV